MRATFLTIVALSAFAAAGCGGDSDDDGGGGGSAATSAATPAASATPTPAATETATPDATSTPAADDGAAADEDRKDEVTVKGRTGDTLTLIGQYATDVSGEPEERERMKVTLIGKRGPFSGFDLPSGRELIGFDIRVTNAGKVDFEDAQPSGVLILDSGETGKPTSLISGTNKNPCDNPSLKLKPGQSKKVCVAFEVPKGAKPLTFQYAIDSGYGDSGLWRLR